MPALRASLATSDLESAARFSADSTGLLTSSGAHLEEEVRHVRAPEPSWLPQVCAATGQMPGRLQLLIELTSACVMIAQKRNCETSKFGLPQKQQLETLTKKERLEQREVHTTPKPLTVNKKRQTNAP